MKHIVVLAPGDTVELCWQQSDGQPTIIETRVRRCGVRFYSAASSTARCELREGHAGLHSTTGVDLGSHAWPERRIESLEQQLTARDEELADIRGKYHELILAVATKTPGETRHDTALRYIRQVEAE